MYIDLDVKYPLFLSDYNETCILPTYLRKTQISSFMKIRPVSAELFHAEGRRTDRYTDMTRPIAAFHNFVKAPKKGQPSKGNLGVRFTIL